jgi:mxaK protein
MAMRNTRGLAIGVVAALIISLVGLAVSAHALYRAHALNTLVMQSRVGKEQDEAPPEALFAKAYQLRKDGNLDAALQLYNQLAQVSGREFQSRLSYNIGNIYVERAQIDAQFGRFKDIGTLVGIARTQYQRALRLDSKFYDAKYNLEYTRFLVTKRDSEQQKYEGGLGPDHEQRKMDWAEFYQMPTGFP